MVFSEEAAPLDVSLLAGDEESPALPKHKFLHVSFRLHSSAFMDPPRHLKYSSDARKEGTGTCQRSWRTVCTAQGGGIRFLGRVPATVHNVRASVGANAPGGRIVMHRGV